MRRPHALLHAPLTRRPLQEQTIKEVQQQAEAWQQSLQQALTRLEAASAIDVQAAPEQAHGAQPPADLG